MALKERLDAMARFLQQEDDELIGYAPDGLRVTTPDVEGEEFYECGCCGAYHRVGFNGDCRDDNERILDLPYDAVIVDVNYED